MQRLCRVTAAAVLAVSGLGLAGCGGKGGDGTRSRPGTVQPPPQATTGKSGSQNRGSTPTSTSP